MRSVTRTLFAGLAAAALLASPAQAQQKVQIGFISTFSGPGGIIGQHMRNSVELALDHLGGKVGGLPVEVIYGDDQQKPDVGKQVADEMLKKHNVDFVSGIIWSNVMLAVGRSGSTASSRGTSRPAGWWSGRPGRSAGTRGRAAWSLGGELEGNVDAAEIVELKEKVRVTGEIRAPRLSVSEGAVFDGRSRMADEAESAGSQEGNVRPLIPTKTGS